MSFVNLGKKRLDLLVKRGFTFGPKTFLYRHGPNFEEDPLGPFPNDDNYQAQLTVKCSSDGDPVFSANTEDSGSGFTIEDDIILLTLLLTPSQTSELAVMCCQYEVFIYTGDVDAPDWSKPLFHGDFEVI